MSRIRAKKKKKEAKKHVSQQEDAGMKAWEEYKAVTNDPFFLC